MTSPRSWSENTVISWLRKNGFGQWESKFRENGVDGRMLLDLTSSEMKEDLGINDINVVASLSARISALDNQHTQIRARKRRKVQVFDPATSGWTVEEIDSLTNYHALYGERLERYLQ